MERFFFSGAAFLTLLEYSLFYLGCTRIFPQWYNYFFLECNSFRLGCCLCSPSRVQSFLPRVQLSFLPRVQQFSYEGATVFVKAGCLLSPPRINFFYPECTLIFLVGYKGFLRGCNCVLFFRLGSCFFQPFKGRAFFHRVHSYFQPWVQRLSPRVQLFLFFV